MPAAKQVIALLSGHIEGDAERVYSVALQIAASEARQGHSKTAEVLRRLVDTAREKAPLRLAKSHAAVATPLSRPRGDIEGLIHVLHSETRLQDMTLTEAVRARLDRLVLQQKQRGRLREFGQQPSSRLLLVGPPGSGKTLTASALAGELHLPLYTVRLEGVITRYLGESASKLRQVFDQIAQMRGVYKRSHVRVEGFAERKAYKRPKRAIAPGDIGRETEKHAEALKRDLAAAWADADGLLALRDAEYSGVKGRYVDFETLPNQPLPDLTWKSKGVRLASADRSPEGEARGTLFIPENAIGFLEQKLRT